MTEYLLLQAVSLIIIKLHHFFNVNNKSKYYSSGGLWKQGRKFRHNVACFHDTQRRTSGKVKVPATFAVWKNNFIHIIGQLKFQMKKIYILKVNHWNDLLKVNKVFIFIAFANLKLIFKCFSIWALKVLSDL